LSSPKQPKKLTTEEWVQLLLDNQEEWRTRLAFVDEEARRIFFSSAGPPLDSNLQFVSVFFYATYLYNLIHALVSDPEIGVPDEVLKYHTELAVELAESAYADSAAHLRKSTNLLEEGEDLDPELRITMKRGDA
jgi:hypothetical protein